jgi:hypothetical protein
MNAHNRKYAPGSQNTLSLFCTLLVKSINEKRNDNILVHALLKKERNQSLPWYIDREVLKDDIFT